MTPTDHGYPNLLIITLAVACYVVYRLARENRYLKSIVWEIKKSHNPLREGKVMTTDEFWEMLRDVNIDLQVVRQETKGRRDHVD